MICIEQYVYICLLDKLIEKITIFLLPNFEGGNELVSDNETSGSSN